MRTDASGWVTRLTDEDIVRYARTGAWRNVTLAECAIRAAEHAPDRLAVVDGSRSLTFGGLLAEARQLTAAFSAMGLRAGDVISYQLQNWAETMTINLAACLAGLVINPIVPIYREAEVRYILRDSRSHAFFIPETFRNFDYPAMAARLRPALPDLREVVVVRGEAGSSRSYADLLASRPGKPTAQNLAQPNAISWCSTPPAPPATPRASCTATIRSCRRSTP